MDSEKLIIISSTNFVCLYLFTFKESIKSRERVNIEEGMPASTRSLLLEDGNPSVNDNGICNEERSHGSSITPILVLSTFIAVCGSFCYGFAVSYTLINTITMFLARTQRFLY